MTTPPEVRPADAKRPVTTPAEAQELFGHLNDVMDALLAIVEEETQLVRAGRLGEVTRLGPTKADLAYLYLGDIARAKASSTYLSQQHRKMLEDLRRRHDNFHCLLQINLTVLATAHAVAEGIMRGVASELNSKAAPQVYGASGRQTAAKPRGVPLAVSRAL
jgi:flagellar biosynthesis/type III secretory pathway chaperone